MTGLFTIRLACSLAQSVAPAMGFAAALRWTRPCAASCSGGALYPCAWRLYGSTTQVYWTTRSADDATGTLSEDVLAPTTDGSGGTLLLGASSAGSPGAGEADGSTEGGLYLPTDDTQCDDPSSSGSSRCAVRALCERQHDRALEGPFGEGRAQSCGAEKTRRD